MKELDKRYNAKEIEERIYKNWEAKGFFKPDSQPLTGFGLFASWCI